MNHRKDITKIIFAIIMLVQFPVYISYAYNQLPETIILENPNPIVQEVEAKEEVGGGEQFESQDSVALTTPPPTNLEATPTPTPTKGPLESKSEIQEYIYEVFGEDSKMALAIAKCESRLNPNAVNDNTVWGGVGRDHSIFQINDVYHANKGDIANLTAEENIRMAKRIFDASTWNAWTCFKTGAYKKEL